MIVNKNQPSDQELKRREKILAENKRLDAYERENKIYRPTLSELAYNNCMRTKPCEFSDEIDGEYDVRKMVDLL